MLQFFTILVMVGLVSIDQIIKLVVIKYLEPIGSIPVIKNFFQFTYVENTGAAFGSFSEYTTLLSIFTAVVLAIGIYILLSKKVKFGFMYVSVAIIISGGAANLFDRIFRGFVVDYIEPLFINFAVFNFADILVSVGAGLLIGYLLYDTIKTAKNEKLNASSEKSDE
ncbi:MAG: signal peptidase II [Oscillospiraceae bacterium]